jgi:hypothetical protein
LNDDPRNSILQQMAMGYAYQGDSQAYMNWAWKPFAKGFGMPESIPPEPRPCLPRWPDAWKPYELPTDISYVDWPAIIGMGIAAIMGTGVWLWILS